MSKNWIYSWQPSFSNIHPQFSNLENSAKITDSLMSGSLVRYHTSLRIAKRFSVTRRTTCHTENYVWILQHVQQQHEVRMWGSKHRETSRLTQPETRKLKKGDSELARGNPLFVLPECLQELRENLVERVPEHRDAPASSCREPVRKEVPGKLQYSCLLRERPELRDAREQEITWAFCRRRTDEAILRTENLDELMPAQHRVLTETYLES